MASIKPPPAELKQQPAHAPGAAHGHGRPAGRRRSIALRLFFTVFLIYAVHFSSNVVRETYLAVALGDRLSVRVDEYLGLHPDLFQHGEGAYINNNPGASLLGALPYFAARPVIAGLFRLKPELAEVKPPAQYDDPRPNRTRFMNEARRRGVDIKLGLAAASMHVGLMAPLGALAALLVFFFFRARLGDERRALWLALLYAFGTPIFFRSGFLNQNALLAHCTLFAFFALAWPNRETREWTATRRVQAAGALLGFGLVCDYSAIPIVLAFALWIAWVAWQDGGASHVIRSVANFALGAAPPVLLLFGYQWLAFGNPLLPAQVYMPATDLSQRGWHGFFWPDTELLLRNLFDLRYGLFVFCPILIAALAAPWLRRHRAALTSRELVLVFAASAALYVFNSSVQFAFLQYNTGVRYMVPAAPLLFVALVPVLFALPRVAMWTVVIATVAVSWSVAMVRESVPTSLSHVFLTGFELPWLTALRKMASGYAPFLQDGVSPVPLFCLIAVVLWLVWRGVQLTGRSETAA